MKHFVFSQVCFGCDHRYTWLPEAVTPIDHRRADIGRRPIAPGGEAGLVIPRMFIFRAFGVELSPAPCWRKQFFPLFTVRRTSRQYRFGYCG